MKNLIDQLIAEIQNSRDVSFQSFDSLYVIQFQAISLGFKMIEEKFRKEIIGMEKGTKFSPNASVKERMERVQIHSYFEELRSLMTDFKD